ncbi:MAG: PaaI family thioesterase [Thermoanaerobaculia bacterium]|nr:PaaI family thioesterase [Thermoanaerobaculia bacterium]
MSDDTRGEQLQQGITLSPFGRLLGFELVDWSPEHVRIKMPFRDDLTTMGNMVHGGATAALADTAATAVAWAGVDPDNRPSRGTTISLDVRYVAAGLGQDLTAEARATKRGRTICFCEVAIRNEADDLVADARAVYKLG